MKKIISLIILSCILAGCSDQYAIEKKYYRTQKEAEKIFRNPNASPPAELKRVVTILSNFAKKYPNSNLAVDAEFNIARLYIVKKEYQEAREYLKTLLNKYSAQSKVIASEVIFLIGNSYEVENKWNSALEQYKKIMQEYPTTIRGINIPIYIAQHYKIKYQPDRMVEAYREAISHYTALANKYAGSPFGLNMKSLAAQCYIALKEWQNAINTLDSIISNYKSKASMDAIMLDMAFIYEKELKDRKKAEETLEQLIRDYPKSRLVKPAQELLKKWNKK